MMKRSFVTLGYLLLTTIIMLIGTVIGQLVVILFASNIFGLKRSEILANPLSAALLQVSLLIVAAIAIVGLLIGWIRWKEKKELSPLFASPLTGTCQGLALGTLMWAIAVGSAYIVGDVGYSRDIKQAATFIPVLTILGWAVQATSEEFVHRGWLLQRLSSRFSVPVAVVISSTIFAVSHGINPDTTLLAYINLALAGVWFALLTIRTGGIVAASAAHTAWNWLEGSGTGLWGTGEVPQGGSLLDFDFVRAGLFGGPGSGLNDGFALTVAFALLIAFDLVLRARSNPRRTAVND